MLERKIQRRESEDVGDHQNAIVAGGLGDHLFARCGVERHWFFDQHVFSSAQRIDRDGRVEVGGDAQIDRIDIGIAQRRGYEFTWNESGELDFGDAGDGFGVRPSHESSADNC